MLSRKEALCSISQQVSVASDRIFLEIPGKYKQIWRAGQRAPTKESPQTLRGQAASYSQCCHMEAHTAPHLLWVAASDSDTLSYPCPFALVRSRGYTWNRNTLL